MRTSTLSAVLLASLCAAPLALAGEPVAVVNGPSGVVNAPLFSRQYESLPVAQVAGQVVTLRELSDALGAVHRASAPGAKAGETNFVPALDRLIGTRLVLTEAHEMGIDELPEVKQEMQAFTEANLRNLVQRALTKGAVASRAEVERRYREAVREWRVRPALFTREEDAKHAAAAIHSGRPFEQVIAQAVAAKQAQGGTELQSLSAKLQVLPQVFLEVQKLAPGGVTKVIAVDKGFTIVKLVEIRHPRDDAARAEAEKQALAASRAAALRAYYAGLVKKHVKADRKLAASIDYESPAPGFAVLKNDKRVLAAVQDEPPVTVADVCEALEGVFFHGVAEAIQQKKLNKRAVDALESLISRRLVAREARLRGLADTEEHRRAVRDHRDELVFGWFVNKAVEPGVKVTEADGLRYYEEHKRAYVLPGFYTLSSLGFESQAAAQSALAKLQSGADFKWLKANAPGQLPDVKLAFQFDSNTVTARSMPAGLLQALEGARSGDLRLYSTAEGHYLIAIRQVTEPAPQPYAEVRAEIIPKVQAEMVNQALDGWIARLRKAREVKVFITRIAI